MVMSSVFCVEGVAQLDGRKPCIWDTYTHSGKMFDGSTGDVTADQYHHYKVISITTLCLIGSGLLIFHLMVSDSRLIPDGRGAINPKGLEYYNNLINGLILHGIQPHVTLFHFDLPQSLEDAYGGWLSPRIVAGDSTEEPYIAAHHVLLSHAEAVELYRENFQAKQKGFISLVILVMWYVPLTNSSKDIAATQRTLDFHNGWFIDPLFFGDYPSSMKKNVGSRLPNFTKEQSKKLKGSFDFVGLNHYGTSYVSDSSSQWIAAERDYMRDSSSKQTDQRKCSSSFIRDKRK
ncbi:beta-glucosidase 31 isoform X2 [Cryptomeria japonica]|uniref:beta-glucosidase 31 isoform X2 n=1 Tax=Cryptomeria japonica TaxID=3369 RepID=UPI0027D9D78D|nr:beta-glucosidase 31 isoform X2 [Cryptomeria japonica]